MEFKSVLGDVIVNTRQEKKGTFFPENTVKWNTCKNTRHLVNAAADKDN